MSFQTYMEKSVRTRRRTVLVTKVGLHLSDAVRRSLDYSAISIQCDPQALSIQIEPGDLPIDECGCVHCSINTLLPSGN